MKQQYFQNLCIKNLSNSISESEKAVLDEWLKSSDKNKFEYERIKRIWESTTPNNLTIELDIDQEWMKLNNLLDNESVRETTNKKSISEIIGSIFTPKLRPALALGTTLIIIVSAILFYSNIETERTLKTITTYNNQKMEVQLSDGSTVHMNSGSKIEYYEEFDDNIREIKLEGEAFFSVNKDGRPFIISTDNAVTTVLGTKFNVWARGKETRVIVKEGKVSLAENVMPENKVILTRGETSKVIETLPPTEPSKIDPEEMIGWLDGKMIFNNTPLFEIVGELERYYDVKVTLDNKELEEYNLTGTFENEKIDSVLSKICLALNLKYIEANDNYRLTQ
jgi:ferric-dicitrate binding protein FerR (iron transport regulator)